MAVTIKDLRFSIYLNNADAKKSAIEMQSQLQKVGDAMQELSNQGKKDTPEYKEKKKAFDDLKASMEANKLEAGLLAMSWGELNKLQKVMANDKSRMIPDSAEWKKLGVDIGVVKGRMAELKGTATETQSSLSKMMEGGVGGFLTSAYSWAAAGIVAVASFFNEYTDDAVKAEKSMQRLSFAVKKVGGGSDSDLEKMAKQAEELMGIFSHEEIEAASTKMLDYGLSTNQVLKLMPLMVDAAAASGKSLEEMATAVDKGVTSGVMARSALGQLGLAFKDTGSKAENYSKITEGLSKFTGGNTEMMKSQWGQLQNNKIQWEEIKEIVGNGLLKVWIPLVDVFSKLAVSAQKTLSIKDLSTEFKEQNSKVLDLTTTTSGLIDRYEVLKDKTKLSKGEQVELNGIIKTIGETIPGAITQFDKYGNALDINSDKAKKYIQDQVLVLQWTKREEIAATEAAIRKLEADQLYYDGNAKLQKEKEQLSKETWAKLNKIDGEAGVKARKEQSDFDLQLKKEKLKRDNDLAGARKTLADLNGDTLKQEMKDREEAEKNKTSLTGGSLNKDEAAKKELERQKKELELITQTIDNAHTDRLTKLKVAKVKENQTEVEYNTKTITEDKAYYDLKIIALENYKKKVSDKNFKADIDKQIRELQSKKAEIDVKFQEKIAKILLDADPVKKENLEYDDRLRELGLFNKKREDLTVDELKVLELLEKQHKDNLFKIRESANNDDLKQREKQFEDEYKSTKEKNDAEIAELSKNAELSKKEGTPFSTFNSIDSDPEIILTKARIKAIQNEKAEKEKFGLDTTKLNEKLIQDENHLTDEYVSKFKQRAELFSKFGEQLGTAIGDLATGNKDALKSALVGMVNLGLDYLKAQAEMAIAGATVQSLSSPESVATFGVAGVAKAAVLVGLIEAAFSAAKTIIGSAMTGKSGYYTGGYTTGATDDSKPVGTVHANEFVTNAKGVRNPSVRKFLDVFNAAQMNGTIHLLNTTQILEKVRAQTPTGYQAGGYVQTNNGSVGSVGSEVAMAIISENAKQMRRLNDHLDNGIHAINTIAGDAGLYKKTQDYEKMLKNVSRQP